MYNVYSASAFALQQLLKGQSKLQKLLSSDKLSDGLSDSPPPLVIQNKKQSSSINVDYRDDTGSTALMLAVLHGHKDVVYTLLQYSAELFTMDNQGYALSFNQHSYLFCVLILVLL